ncbi:MAG: DMT family transporter [Aestuariivirgaceae bacterium]
MMRASHLTNNAVLLLTLTTLIWGSNAVAGKLAVGHISPFLLTSARWTGATLVLLVIARRELPRDWPVIRAHLPYLFLMGALGFAAFNGLLYTSLKFTTAINVTILQAGMPMFIFAFNFIVFRTRLQWAQTVGYALTLLGVMLTALAGDLSALAELAINRGDLIMLVAVVVYAAYSVALRAKPQMHWLSFLTVLVISAAFTSIFMAGYEATTEDFIWPTTVTGWSLAVYTAILPSIIAQGCYIRGIELLGGNKASLFLNLVPIFGSMLSVLLLGEAFYTYHAIALALVIGGIVFAQLLSRPA